MDRGCDARATRLPQRGGVRAGPELTVPEAVRRYRERALATAEAVRSMPVTRPTADGTGRDLRWVLLHLLQVTARHAGHADATRELLDGTTGT